MGDPWGRPTCFSPLKARGGAHSLYVPPTTVTQLPSWSKRLILCEPERLPLPVVLRAAGRPTADQHLPEMQLREMVRLGERGLMAMQERWKPIPSGEIAFHPKLWNSDDIEDLLWLQDELSGDILDLYDRHRPGSLEKRAGELCSRLQAVLHVPQSLLDSGRSIIRDVAGRLP